MEALETCIGYWEDALAIYRTKDSGGAPLTMLSTEEAGFCRDLQLLLDSAIELQVFSAVFQIQCLVTTICIGKFRNVVPGRTVGAFST